MAAGGFSDDPDDPDDDVRGAPAPDGGDLTSGTPKTEYDDAPGNSPPLDETDPVAAELGVIFAAALADEPESSVTPMSVLHAVRADRERRTAVRWSREWVAWKWGGGLAVAAAAVAAVFIVGSSLGTHEATSTAGAASGASTGASAAAAADSGQPTAALPAQSTAGGSAESGAPALGLVPPNSEKAQDSSGQAADSAAGAGSGTAGGAGIAPESGESYAAAPETGDLSCPALDPLSAAERAALVRAFPQGRVTDAPSAEACPPNSLHALRGSRVETPWSGAELGVMIYDWSHGAPIIPPSPAMAVAVAGNGTAVWVMADPAATAHVTKSQLSAIANAVLAAAVP